MTPEKRGDRDYLWIIADPAGALADREGVGAKTNRACELTVFSERFRGFKPRIATGVYGNDLYEALLNICQSGKHQ